MPSRKYTETTAQIATTKINGDGRYQMGKLKKLTKPNPATNGSAVKSPRTSKKLDKNGHNRGRPLLPLESVRKSITFRMNEEERELVEKASTEMMLTLTAWIRRAIVMSARRQLKGKLESTK